MNHGIYRTVGYGHGTVDGKTGWWVEISMTGNPHSTYYGPLATEEEAKAAMAEHATVVGRMERDRFTGPGYGADLPPSPAPPGGQCGNCVHRSGEYWHFERCGNRESERYLEITYFAKGCGQHRAEYPPQP